jgi:hypothetical protein
MAKYLISFPSAAMVVPDGEWEAVGRDSHAVIDEAKAAGVYVFGGGIDEDVPPALVSADGAVAEGGYPWAPPLDGGFTVLELPSREQAVAWAARIAKTCAATRSCASFSSTRSPEGGGALASRWLPPSRLKSFVCCVPEKGLHVEPSCLLQLWTTYCRDRGRACACFHLPLPGLSTPNGQRLRSPSQVSA